MHRECYSILNGDLNGKEIKKKRGYCGAAGAGYAPSKKQRET